MSDFFPRTNVGGVSLPRMIMGINWLLGWSHTGAAADAGIREKYQRPEDFFPVFKAYVDRGVDAILGPLSKNELGLAALKYAEDKLGKGRRRYLYPLIPFNGKALATVLFRVRKKDDVKK